jgi:hypothetical protein
MNNLRSLRALGGPSHRGRAVSLREDKLQRYLSYPLTTTGRPLGNNVSKLHHSGLDYLNARANRVCPLRALVN